MPLDPDLLSRLQTLLAPPGESHSTGPRLIGDAKRLHQRIECFMQMNLIDSPIDPPIDSPALQLACYALQLPLRPARSLSKSTPPPKRPSLRDRCEQAAELMVTLLSGVTGAAGDDLLDAASRILHQTPERAPASPEARLLADALNLDDFGLIGFINQTLQIAAAGDGIAELAAAADKREQYGYWDARLKDGFNFPPIRALAADRLAQSRKAFAQLKNELTDDQPQP